LEAKIESRQDKFNDMVEETATTRAQLEKMEEKSIAIKEELV